jgi:hypothetical protein
MKPMRQTLKAIAILALAVAMLNASPGLCFCRHAIADAASGDAGDHSCCHRSSPTLSNTGFACCQIDRAERQATSPDSASAMDATPASPISVVGLSSTAPRTLHGPVVAVDHSPPVQHLRV